LWRSLCLTAAGSVQAYHEEETIDISSIATGDILDIKDLIPCQYYDYKKGSVEIVILPTQDPNFYDLDKWSDYDNDFFWDKHEFIEFDDVKLLNSEDMEEIKAVIAHSLNLEKEARNKYLALDIHTAINGNFEYTYRPRYIIIDQPMPTDNPYIKIYKEDGRNMLICALLSQLEQPQGRSWKERFLWMEDAIHPSLVMGLQ